MTTAASGQQREYMEGVPRLLNLGSGEDYRDDWHNVDYNERYGPDQVADLEEDWPLPSGHFDTVLASHVFEHLTDLEHAFSEAARVLRDGGVLRVKVPVGVNARTDWTHEHEWTYDTPLQFAQNWQEKTDDYQFDPSVPFELENRRLSMVTHGPFRFFSPVIQRFARTMPGVWTSGAPFASGELTAVFRRCPR